MMTNDTAKHIVSCSACGKPINVLHKPSWVIDFDGKYYHATDACWPENPQDRADRLWKMSQPQTD